MSDEQGETGTQADDAATQGPDGDGHEPDDLDPAGGNGTSTGAADGQPDADATDGRDGEAADERERDAEPVAEIADRIADREPETVAEEIHALREEVWGLQRDLEDLESERDDLEDRLKRKVAEFQNYKKRQEKRREEVRERATESLVEELVEVRDNLDRALQQDADADIREGVEATFRQLDDVLASENVEPIEPEPGSEVDPARHEVLLNVESEQPDGTVAEVHRPGYEMAGKVLRAAQVTVAEGDPE